MVRENDQRFSDHFGYLACHQIYKEFYRYFSDSSLVRYEMMCYFRELLADMGTMVDLLQTVKKSIDNNLFPPVGTVRQLNHTYSTSLLFGQYVAGIFEAL